MISATKLSTGGVVILLIIVISQKKDKSGRVVRNPLYQDNSLRKFPEIKRAYPLKLV